MFEYKVIVRKSASTDIISNADRDKIFPAGTPYCEYDTIRESVTFTDQESSDNFIKNAVAIVPELAYNEDIAMVSFGDNGWSHSYRRCFGPNGMTSMFSKPK